MTPASPAQRRSWLLPGLLVATLALNVLALPNQRYVGDPYAMSAEARSLVLRGELAIEPEMDEALAAQPGQYLVKNPRDGKLYSKYGLASSLILVPALAAEKWLTPPAAPR